MRMRPSFSDRDVVIAGLYLMVLLVLLTNL